MKDIVIVDGARTPIGTMGGMIKDVHAADLGATTIREALNRANVSPELVEEVIVGNVGQVAENAYIARMCALRAGLPSTTTALSLNRLCGSGLQAINSAVQSIKSEDAEVVVAAGTENMDLLPYYVRKARYGYKFGHSQLEDGLTTALTDPFGNYAMGVTAEKVAERFEINREDQDRFALRSQKRAIDAIENDYFKDEIVPVEVKGKRGEITLFDEDEHPRHTSLEKLSKLKPAFMDGGSVTAGNAAGINQGAAAVVVMTQEKAEELGLKPIAYVREQAVAGLEPEIMGFAPAPAVTKVLHKSNLALDDIDLVELNEAFAAQAVAVIRDLGIDEEKVNPNGGAIALGHPLGGTGTILTVKSLYDMKRRGLTRAIVTMCIGGGQGIATIFENIK
ncbi:thiolase family protein [Tuberibacillus sp. Marseille-P3662]|uniref:thiolase family protein n=1 Tax=Tuberibacillus sp. Marseille-P3662 TaxID=1965358 RepID=UPI000A1C97BA|nr:thiolase family protein [Tuberibacillus sp. Marseille-P3662]